VRVVYLEHHLPDFDNVAALQAVRVVVEAPEYLRTGAPDAVQVAVGRAVRRRAPRLPARTRPRAGRRSRTRDAARADASPATAAGREFADRTRRHHAMLHDLLADGCTIRAVARHLGWGRHTVQRYARAATWQQMADGRWQAPRPSMLDPFKPHLDQGTDESCGNAAQLFREITALGYTGGYSTVRDYLDQHRPAPVPFWPPPPTVRGHQLAHPAPDSLTEDEQPQLKAPARPLPRTPGRFRSGSRIRGHAHPAHRAGPPAVD
jgi:hypothetical protein